MTFDVARVDATPSDSHVGVGAVQVTMDGPTALAVAEFLVANAGQHRADQGWQQRLTGWGEQIRAQAVDILKDSTVPQPAPPPAPKPVALPNATRPQPKPALRPTDTDAAEHKRHDVA